MPTRRNIALVPLTLIVAGCASVEPAPQIGTHPDQIVTTTSAVGPCAHPALETTGSEVDSQAIGFSTLGHGPMRVYLIGLIHGDETEGYEQIGRLLSALETDEVARLATIRVCPSMNPGGHASGLRGNSRGVDLNRNWPAENFLPSRTRGPRPLSEYETRAVHDDLHRFAPDVVVVFHSTHAGPFVNFDGPGEAYASAFAQAAAHADRRWRVVREMGYPTPGSLGSHAGDDLGIPTLTIEFRRGQDPGAAREAAERGLRAIMDAGPPG